MSGRKNVMIAFGLILSAGLIASALTAVLISRHYGRTQFALLNAVFGEVLEQEPEIKPILSAALKECMGWNTGRTADWNTGWNTGRTADWNTGGNMGGTADWNTGGNMGGTAVWNTGENTGWNTDRNMNSNTDSNTDENTGNRYGTADGTEVGDVLSSLGYQPHDLSASEQRATALFAAAGFFAGSTVLLFTVFYRNRQETGRIQALTDYLEKANTGKAAVLSATGEDAFSKLEDEIYKTVTYLYQTKDDAIQIKNDFAENLSNIAHQIKTPITAISLSVQTLGEKSNGRKMEQIQRQLHRLTRLEEALLMLSRLDAGTLCFQREETDVFTILVLAADNLQELLAESGTSVDIPEAGEMAVKVDLGWTMEAVINLMKNCMEHNRGGTVHCIYKQNPLYTEICIWDEGAGFDKDDIPHLFERFYRGKNACEGGIGIGLSLSREIIQRQNGTLRAKNMPGGGACFEIRFYSH